jgi:HUS1 checkpoint protein
MKFRASVAEGKMLLSAVSVMDRCCKHCVIHFTASGLTLAAQSDSSESPRIWSSIPKALVFSDYVCESMNNNEIGLYVQTSNLLRALKSADSASEVSIRLRKKDGTPILCFEIQILTPQIMSISHDLPVDLLNPDQLNLYREPGISVPLVQVLCPPVRLLKKAFDRMKSVSSIVTITVSHNGELSFTAESDITQIGCHFNQLEHPPLKDGASQSLQSSSEAIHVVHMESKLWQKVFYLERVPLTHVMLCLLEGRTAVMYALMQESQGTLVVSMHLPTRIISDDGEDADEYGSNSD